MRVDRSRFLELTVLLAAGCGAPRGDSKGPSDTTVQLAAPPVVDAAAPIVLLDGPDAASTPAPPKEPAFCNESASGSGSVHAACMRVSPACEGLRDECESLGEDLRPKMAEAWAECMAKTTAKACRARTLGSCFRAAIENGCIDDEARTKCDTLMNECKSHGKKPRYTLEQCAKVLSATGPGGPGDWRVVDEERLGFSPAAEACSLTYVLPYQPWGPSWR